MPPIICLEYHIGRCSSSTGFDTGQGLALVQSFGYIDRMKTLLPRVVLASLVAVCLAAGELWAASPVSDCEQAARLIAAERLGEYVTYLAADAFEGREAGSRGGRAIGDFLAERVKKLGLKPAGTDGGYFQPFGEGMRNVLSLVPGRDPALAKQVIVMAAHYDHVGYGTARNSRGPIGYIHNGADDNASGVSGMMAAAEAFCALKQPPRRSVLIAFWDGEEKGLLGSQHWLANPTIPLDRVVLSITADMIGRLRDDHLVVYGSRTSDGLRRLAAQANAALGLSLDFSWAVEHDSDHYPFFAHGIPIVFFFTGKHDEYHTPRDKANLINKPGMERVARLMFTIAYELANRDETPRFRPASQTETGLSEQSLWAQQPGANAVAQGKPLRLGITWRSDEAEPGTVVLTSVAPGSPAALAGLTPGDRVLQLGGRDFASEEEFGQQIGAAPFPVELRVEHNGRIRAATIKSAGATTLQKAALLRVPHGRRSQIATWPTIAAMRRPIALRRPGLYAGGSMAV